MTLLPLILALNMIEFMRGINFMRLFLITNFGER